MKYGIWLDSNQAHIIGVGTSESMDTINSEVEHFNLKGGARASTPYGAQMTGGSESKLLERKKHQLKTYFENISARLTGATEIAIFGPADTKFGLKKALEDYPGMKATTVTVETADSMTQNQVRALVRNHFENKEE